VAKPLHEIMAESSAGLARQNDRRKQDMADRQSYGLGNLEARMNRRPGRFTRVLDDLSGAISSGIGNVGGKIGRKAKDFGNTLSDFYGSVTKPGFFGGLQAAEINPKRVLASKWAQTPIDWEDIEGGMFSSPIGYEDAWKALQDINPKTNKPAGTNYDINTWGDLYGLLQPGSSVPGLPGKVLEKGLGSFSSELGETGMFPKKRSMFQVKPTVKTGKGFRNYFDIAEGSLESGVYPNLQKQNWLY
jgi:hypothetical protein